MWKKYFECRIYAQSGYGGESLISSPTQPFNNPRADRLRLEMSCQIVNSTCQTEPHGHLAPLEIGNHQAQQVGHHCHEWTWWSSVGVIKNFENKKPGVNLPFNLGGRSWRNAVTPPADNKIMMFMTEKSSWKSSFKLTNSPIKTWCHIGKVWTKSFKLGQVYIPQIKVPFDFWELFLIDHCYWFEGIGLNGFLAWIPESLYKTEPNLKRNENWLWKQVFNQIKHDQSLIVHLDWVEISIAHSMRIQGWDTGKINQWFLVICVLLAGVCGCKPKHLDQPWKSCLHYLPCLAAPNRTNKVGSTTWLDEASVKPIKLVSKVVGFPAYYQQQSSFTRMNFIESDQWGGFLHKTWARQSLLDTPASSPPPPSRPPPSRRPHPPSWWVW